MADCFKLVKKLLPDVEDETIQIIADRIDDAKKGAQFGDQGSFQELVQQEFSNFVKAQIKRRLIKATAIKAGKRQNGFIAQPNLKYKIKETFKAYGLGGGKGLGEENRFGVDAQARAFADITNGPTVSRLDDIGMLEAMHKDPNIQRQVSKVMHEMHAGGDRSIVEAAGALVKKAGQILKDHNAAIMAELRRAGIPIGEIENFISHQGHSAERIMKGFKGNFDDAFAAWHDFAVPKMNKAKTFGINKTPQEIRVKAREMFDDIVGNRHDRYAPESVSSEFMTASDRRAIQSQIDRSRKIHWEDGGVAHDYNMKLGNDSIMDSVLASSRRAGRSSALVERFGVDAEIGIRGFKKRIENFYKKLAREGDEKAQKALSDLSKISDDNIRFRYDELAGFPAQPGLSLAGKFRDAYLVLKQITQLGLATLSSFTDVGTATMAIKNIRSGKNLAQAGGDFVTNMTKGLSGKELKKAQVALGQYSDDFIAMQKMNDGETIFSKQMFKTLDVYYKLNGLSQWTARVRAGVSIQGAQELLLSSGKKFSELDQLLREGLGSTGVKSQHWDVMRIAQENLGNNRNILSVEAIRNLPDEALHSIIKANKLKISPANLKVEAQIRYTTWLNNLSDVGSPLPNARTRSMLRLGVNPNSGLGMVIKVGALYKSFPLSMHNVISQSILSVPGGKAQSITEALGSRLQTLKTSGFVEASGFGKTVQEGNFKNLAQLSASNMALAYVAIAAKEAVQGRTIGDLDNIELANRALIQSGTGGLMGDLFLGEYHKRGRSVLAGIAGPAGSDIENIGEILSTLKSGDRNAVKKAQQKLFFFGKSMAPGGNLFYLKAAFNYALFYHIQHALNPRSLINDERRRRKKGQKFFLPKPSKVVR